MPLRKFAPVPDAYVISEGDQSNAYARDVYMAVGEDDETRVELFAAQTVPQAIATSVGTLYRQPMSVRRIGFEVYEVDVEWGQKKWGALEWSIRGRTTGGTQKVLGSLSTVSSSSNAPNFNGLIGVNADGTIEGTEVIVPTTQLAIDVVYPRGSISNLEIAVWTTATSSVNLSPVLGWPAGEVLYEGAEFEHGSDIPRRVTHNISISPNLSNFTAAGLTIAEKQGWDFLWFRVVEETAIAGGTTYAVKRATHYYVERLYRRLDLASLLRLPPGG